MDADTIKLVLFIAYMTLLVIVALVWFRLILTPNGELYRKVRLQGGYMPEGGQSEGEVGSLNQPAPAAQS